jgi:putative OPT family oligopeptide transporter
MSTAAKPAFKPYVPDEVTMTEFTWSAVLLGAVLGIVFSASSLYLVLKVGMTVSASIPVAVLSITLFRAFTNAFGMAPKTILENNIVQTTGSAGESIAFGVGVTMPALLLLGFDMDLGRVMLVSVLGGLLGILAMIPLRRAFIVRMHGRPGEPGTLLYPEGTACAQVLISGDKGGTTGKTVFIGFGIAFAHKFITEGLKLLEGTVALPLEFVNRTAKVSTEMASELLGVGYIIGLRTSGIMMAGAVLGYLVIIPIIAFIGDNISEQTVPPGTKLIRDMDEDEIRGNYLLFIGAGCVAAAGIISMCRTLPMIVRSVRSGLSSMRGGSQETPAVRRTENDMSMKTVLLGSVALIIILTGFLMTEVGWISAILGAVLVILFGFLFVTVSARLTGEIGSSSNPISGMTVATLMLTCLIFLALGWTTATDRILALSIAAVVCIACSNGGTTAQSLKTGFLLGGTPKLMQYAILFGALTSALVIGGLLLLMNAASTVYSKKQDNLPALQLSETEMKRLKAKETYEGKEYLVWNPKDEQLTKDEGTFKARPEVKEIGDKQPGHYLIDPETGKPAFLKDHYIMGKLKERDDGSQVKRDAPAPKTQVMGLIINGVLKRDLNWSMVLIGALIAITLELCGISALAFAVGVYVPIQYSAPIFLGGIIRWAVDTYQARSSAAAIAAAETAEEKAAAEIEAIRKSETSPGVLMASGYIAGGSLAGMMLAFFAFSDELPKYLATWQYRSVVVEAGEYDKITEHLARQELGLTGELDERQKAQVKTLQEAIAGMKSNSSLKIIHMHVPKGVTLKLPDGKTHVVAEDTTMGKLAEQLKASAQALWDTNNLLKKPSHLPAGTVLKIEQPDKSVHEYSFMAPLKPREEWAKEVAVQELRRELGQSGKKLDLNDQAQKTHLNEIETKVNELIDRELLYAVPVPKGTKLGVAPNAPEYVAEKDTTLGEVAATRLGDRSRAEDLLKANAPLSPAEHLPAGSAMKVPQHTWPALVAFAVLIAILLATGMEKILKGKPEEATATAPQA